jgi:tRNA 5-methylaminomethyl-2-thiouridine biosynthesis bifunctional protein
MFRRIEPPRVVPDPGGAPFNLDFGDVYASRDGALAQARHVFLHGNDLPQRWARRDQFVILETGFGLGVNFFATWRAWRDDSLRPRRLQFVSVEKHPVDVATLLRCAPEEVAPLARALAAVWPLPVSGMHRCEFEDGCVTLTLVFDDIEVALPQVVAGVDAFFLDGFAPDRNPAMWSVGVMKSLTRLARTDATLATWCTARGVRDGLAAAGFEVTRSEGFAHKREMLRGRFAPRWRMRRHDPPEPWRGAREAVVVGAGLAGAFVAFTLAQRGWRVTVLERGPRVASGASALPWGLLHPMVTPDDNGATRLVRAGFLLGLALLAREPSMQGSMIWRPQGTLVQAAGDDEAAQWRALASQLQLPANYARVVDIIAAADLLGLAPRRGGWWFGQGAIVAPPALCRALLRHAHVRVRESCAVARVVREGDAWLVADGQGRALASAPVCIVATALDAPALLGLRHTDVRAIRGQVSIFDAPALSGLRAATSGGGTLMRIDDRTVGVGASYEMGPDGTPVDAGAAHRGNRERLQRLVAGAVEAEPTGLFDGVRCVARDRSPLVGGVPDEDAAFGDARVPNGAHLADLPRHAGLFASFAFGSRGLALAPLAAHLIAAQIEGEPWPLERELAGQIDVARFLLDAMRRRRVG